MIYDFIRQKAEVQKSEVQKSEVSGLAVLAV
jgi:hypothetical protein